MVLMASPPKFYTAKMGWIFPSFRRPQKAQFTEIPLTSLRAPIVTLFAHMTMKMRRLTCHVTA
jgi:hypothetical protein